MKHISTSSSENVGYDSQEITIEESEETSKPAPSTRTVSGKIIYQEKALELNF